MIQNPSILYRFPGYVHMHYRNEATIAAYRVRVADSVDNAYGNFNGVGGVGTAPLFDVMRGTSYIATSIVRKGLIPVSNSNRGQTTAIYDPQDFFNPPTTVVVPPDNRIAYLRTQVRILGGAFPGTVTNQNQSPIKIVDKSFLAAQKYWPALTVYGTSPLLPLVAGNFPTEDTMRIVVPSYVKDIVFTNVDTMNPLLYSTDIDEALVPLAAGTTVTHFVGKILCICAAAGNPKFSIIFEYQPHGDQ